MKKSLLILILVFGFCLLSACGGGSGSTPPPPPPPTTFSVPVPATATVGTAFSFTVTALDSSNNVATSYSGTVHFTSADSQAVLPANSMLANGTGTFSATLKTAGGQTITATDTVKGSITGTSSSITVGGNQVNQLAITSGAPPAGTEGIVYNSRRGQECLRTEPGCFCRGIPGDGTVCFTVLSGFTLTASGGVSPYNWTWAPSPNSSLPPGMSLNQAVIAGTPTAAGTFNVVVTVTDSAAPPSHESATYSITIAPPAPPAINPVSPAIGTLNSPYPGFQFTASGGAQPLTWSETGALPSGLQLSTSGLLSGIPTAAGSFPITVMAEDTDGQNSAPVNFTIQVLTEGFALSGSMETQRVWHTATLLQDGNVLVTGGANNTTLPTTAELYDSATKKFTQTTGSPTTPRTNATATLLSSGKVLIAGGKAANGGELTTADIYDPASETFAASTNTMSDSRAYHTATLLNDGTVLVAGGLDLAGDASEAPVASAEIYDPATNSFSLTRPITEGRYFHTATLLANGMVLITGGLNLREPIATAEIYNPATKTFTATGMMTTAWLCYPDHLRGNGQVLVAGGAGSLGGAAMNTAELFDSSAGTFTATNVMTSARSAHTATLLQNGQVLVAGGAGFFYGSGESSSMSSVELFDPSTGNFTPTADMTTVRESHTATLLNSGQVLAVGGSNGTLGFSTATTVLATAELYH